MLPREQRVWLLGAIAIGFVAVGLALTALTPRQTVREEVA
jgi:hypothetical protein